MTLEPQEPIRVAALADLRRLERENDAWQEAIAAQIQAGKAEIAAIYGWFAAGLTSMWGFFWLVVGDAPWWQLVPLWVALVASAVALHQGARRTAPVRTTSKSDPNQPKELE